MAIWDRIKKAIGGGVDKSDPDFRSEIIETGSFVTPEDGDRQILQQLIEHGCDLSKPRHVLHYLFFDDEESASHVAKELIERSYEVLYYESASEKESWVVKAERTGLVNEREVAAERFVMTTLAEAHDGEYDGWEAAASDD